MKLLHLDSSILGDHSVSRILSAGLVAAQKKLHPDLEITYHDLAAQPLQHLSGAHLAAFQGAPADPGLDLAESGTAMEQLLATDILVIGAPMYNFGIPSQLKAWVDRITVAGKTFQYTESGPKGLLVGKKAFIASARGGAYADTPIAFLDHQESYLQAILGFIGISEVTVVRAENAAREGEKEKSIAAAKSEIAALG